MKTGTLWAGTNRNNRRAMLAVTRDKQGHYTLHQIVDGSETHKARLPMRDLKAILYWIDIEIIVRR